MTIQPKIIQPKAGAPRQPGGSVLLFTLVILVLLGIMGFSIMASTRTELSVSSDIRLGRGAFQQADLTLRVALLAALASINPVVGNPCDVFRSLSSPSSGRPAYEVRFGSSSTCGTGSGGSTSDLVVPDVTSLTQAEITNRYLQAVESGAAAPQIRILYGGQEVGTAALIMHYGETSGGSEGEGGRTPVYLVVRANGRLPRAAGEATNYFEVESGATHSIIMGVYRFIL